MFCLNRKSKGHYVFYEGKHSISVGRSFCCCLSQSYVTPDTEKPVLFPVHINTFKSSDFHVDLGAHA